MRVRGPAMATQRIKRYSKIVDHFEEVARANVGNLAHVEELCHIAEINQRTLSRAFREIRGTTPCRYLRYLRLSEVKRVLSQEGGSITQAAMRFGFRELGRFGVLYKTAFGERPSQTRQRARSVVGLSDQIHEAPHHVNDRKEAAP
jgi:transcriptional regulator GlxA family with amidase domain